LFSVFSSKRKKELLLAPLRLLPALQSLPAKLAENALPSRVVSWPTEPALSSCAPARLSSTYISDRVDVLFGDAAVALARGQPRGLLREPPHEDEIVCVELLARGGRRALPPSVRPI